MEPPPPARFRTFFCPPGIGLKVKNVIGKTRTAVPETFMSMERTVVTWTIMMPHGPEDVTWPEEQTVFGGILAVLDSALVLWPRNMALPWLIQLANGTIPVAG